jgi:hypothetical protein
MNSTGRAVGEENRGAAQLSFGRRHFGRQWLFFSFRLNAIAARLAECKFEPEIREALPFQPQPR